MCRIALPVVVAFALVVGAGGLGFADEEESPAEVAFRDGWWAETSEGALDRAIERYRAATAAEGPAEVKAKAWYRLGVLLERIGKTGEAVQALERLGALFPEQQEILAEARERLEEWTATDLKEGFGAWYRRYQYSPEFQGRIVEQVLNLSAPPGEAQAAENELLTIGEPALAALKAHVGSSNEDLRERVVKLLVILGEIPEAHHLGGTDAWRRDARAWKVLFALAAERRAAVAEGLRTQAPAIARVLGDGAERARGLAELGDVRALSAALEAPSEDLLQGLREAVVDPSVDEVFRGHIADVLRSRGHASDAVALGWLERGSGPIAQRVLQSIQRRTLRSPDAWRRVAALLDRTHPESGLVNDAWPALLAAIADAPEGTDVTPAVEAVVRVWSGQRVNLAVGVTPQPGMQPSAYESSPARAAFLAALVSRSRDPRLAAAALDAWRRATEGEPGATAPALAWAADPLLDPSVRRLAARIAAERTDADGLDAVLAALAKAEEQVGQALLEGLARNRLRASLPWTEERMAVLMDVARASHGHNDVRDSEVRTFFEAHLKSRAAAVQLIAFGLARPKSLAWSATQQVPMELKGDVLLHAAVLSGLEERWARWTSEERAGGLILLKAFAVPVTPGSRAETAVKAWLHAPPARHAAPGPEDRHVRAALFGRLPAPSAEDVIAAIDREDPEAAVDGAWMLKEVPLTAALYDVFAAARRHPDAARRLEFYRLWAGAPDVALRYRAARDLLDDPDAGVKVAALSDLAAFQEEDPKDVPLFVQALSDPRPDVKIAAATVLGRYHDASAIDALVKALDDPSPRVREAALASLEAIRKIRDQKAYWSAFAAGRER
jgi:hypothetical protein